MWEKMIENQVRLHMQKDFGRSHERRINMQCIQNKENKSEQR